MVDRVIAVRLKIEVDEAKRNAKAAADAFRGIATAVDSAGNSGASMSRLATAARSVGRTVATVSGLAAGGMLAVTAATVKGGVAYNTLEQTSRAALKTVLGSASAASNQMDRLREFGKTSPFPRQVWISAQQQLLAFGMSAEKIIPTFKAVQDAVAASGGGSQQITEVVDVLAKVQSTGKVTAETLNELGYRGIDAATLVGQAMGKTAAQVRADIQSQAISGVQFIDVLTKAMETRFGGAAANVKQTWEGAKDRIKGAVRDIGSLLATPLVDPEGGGAAVEWANAIADALRALEARLGPVMAAIGDRAGPLLDAFTEKLKHLAEWIKTADFSKIGSQIHGMLPAIVGVTAGFGAMGAKSIPIIGDMVSGLRPLPVALAAAALASPALRSALLDLLSAAQPLIQAVGQATQMFATALGPALSVVAALLQPVIAIVQFLSNVLAGLPAPVQALVGALALIGGLGLTGKLNGIIESFRNFGSEMQAQRKFAEMAGQEVGTLGSAYSVAASRVSGAAVGIRGAIASASSFLAGPWGIAVGLGVSALSLFATSQDQAAVSTQDFNVELDRQTGLLSGSSVASIYKWASAADTLTDNGSHVSDILKDMGISARDLTGYLTGNAAATARVETALKGVDNEVVRGYYKKWLEETRGKINDQKNAQKTANSATDEYSAAADGAAQSTNALSGALSATSASATDASTRLQQLNADLSAYYDSQFAQQEAADKFQSGLHGLAGLFDGNAKAATKSTQTGDKFAESLKRQAQITKDANKQLKDLAESQRQAEKEAREAAEAAKQRRLDELFGKQFDVQSTRDAFASSLAQTGTDIKQARKDKTAGATSLTGISEGALANRDRMRNLVQQAQAAIQAEIDRGASKARVSAVTKDLQAQLAAQAKTWGLNAQEVKGYTSAIAAFGGIANTTVKPNLAAVRKDFAEQRAEIKANTAEQIQSAKQSGVSAQASSTAAAATKIHTAALTGNSESAIENRNAFRQQVKAAQDELAQMALNGASKEQLTRRGKELSTQLVHEATQLGFNKKDINVYTAAIRDSAVIVARYPALNVRAQTAGALTTIANFVRGVDRAMGRIKKNYQLGLTTAVPGTSRFLPGLSATGGHAIAATGGYIRGPGGPKGDKIPAMLSDTEYVQQAAAVKFYGVDFMHALNARRVPKGAIPGFAGGGPVNLQTKAILAGGMGRAIAGVRNAFRDELYGGFFGGGSIGGSGVQRWAPLVLEVLRLLHQPAGMLSHVLRRMSQESGGNPQAINNWDSNAARGTPSIGLMQTIGPTFAAYAGPFLRRGIYDPLANIYAGINYAIHRYGNLMYAMDKPGGYRLGGLVKGGDGAGLMGAGEFMRGSYRNGTNYVPMDGMYRLHRGERVVPVSQNRAAEVVLVLRPDGSRWGDAVVDTLHKADANGRVHLRTK